MQPLVLLLSFAILLGVVVHPADAAPCSPSVQLTSTTTGTANGVRSDMEGTLTATGQGGNALGRLVVTHITNAAVRVNGAPVSGPTTLPFSPPIPTVTL